MESFTSVSEVLYPDRDGALLNAAEKNYLNNLTTLSLTDLLAEPTSLQTQSHHLTSSLTSLTHTSYSTFLTLHSSTSALSASLISLSDSLNALTNSSLPALEAAAAGWTDRTSSLLSERQKARQVLDQHDKIRDLLDIPLLIDACVRNGYFAEALSLAVHARSLAQRPTTDTGSSTPPPPLILRSVLAEVQHSITQMLFSLLATLHEHNRKLPGLWKAVNFLRKMDVFGSDSQYAPVASGHVDTEPKVSSEDLIALAFLTGREGCLKASLDGIARDIQRLVSLGAAELRERDQEDLAKFLKKYIDTWREGVYDIITQYSTIFLDSPAQPASGKLPSKQVLTNGQSHDPQETPPSQRQTLRRLLTTHTSHALDTHLLSVLRSSLTLLPPSLLPSLLTQLTYCSTAFSRVGMDFRGALSDLFGRAIVEGIKREMDAATSKFARRVTIARWGKQRDITVIVNSDETSRRASLVKERTKVKEHPSKWLVSSSVASGPALPQIPTKETLLQAHAHIPPVMLASYPPIAELTNAILGTLNVLRMLAPTSVISQLLDVLDRSLVKAGSPLMEYIRATLDGEIDSQEQSIARNAAEVFVVVLVPFLRRALLEGVYGLRYAEWIDAEGSEIWVNTEEWRNQIIDV